MTIEDIQTRAELLAGLEPEEYTERTEALGELYDTMFPMEDPLPPPDFHSWPSLYFAALELAVAEGVPLVNPLREQVLQWQAPEDVLE